MMYLRITIYNKKITIFNFDQHCTATIGTKIQNLKYKR